MGWETVEILNLSHDGRGVARRDGKALFVAGALPGERVRVEPLRRHRRFDEAKLVELVEPAPERTQPVCPHFGSCGGCSLQHLAGPAQWTAGERILRDALERIGGITPECWWSPLTGPTYGYRRRGRLGVRYEQRRKRIQVGFRKSGRHSIAAISNCPVLTASSTAMPGELTSLIHSLSTRKAFSQVEFAFGDISKALIFRVSTRLTHGDINRLLAFGREHGYALWLQSGEPETLRLLVGPALLGYSLADFSLRLHFLPSDFVQANAEVNRLLVADAVQRLELNHGSRVLELFSGMGNFSLALARRAGEVVAVEGDVSLVRRARANARANGIENSVFHLDDLAREPRARLPWLTKRPDAVLLDPPHSGAAALIPALIGLRPQRIFYVSCHPATLARDAAGLIKGGFRLRGAGIAAMFPNTGHVESRALFEAN